MFIFFSDSRYVTFGNELGSKSAPLCSVRCRHTHTSTAIILKMSVKQSTVLTAAVLFHVFCNVSSFFRFELMYPAILQLQFSSLTQTFSE